MFTQISANAVSVYFQAFEPIFGDIYGFNPGEIDLCFLPIGVGSWFATAAYLWWEWCLGKAKNKPDPPAWTKKEEYDRLPLAWAVRRLSVSPVRLREVGTLPSYLSASNGAVLAWVDRSSRSALDRSSHVSFTF